MKKIFSSMLLAVVVMTSFAQVKQDTSQHLTFKGVPIDGTLDDYVSKMKQGGFTLIQTEDGTAILNGDFAGYKDCNIGVSTLKQKDLVHKIAVIFPKKDTWSTLSGNYFDLKQLLTEKYGKPSQIVEKFDGYSEPRDDDNKMYKVKFDNCKYYSIWETDKGEIQLSIAHNSVTSCFVTLAYFDKINGDKIKAKAKDDL
jgi:hypothetical protein